MALDQIAINGVEVEVHIALLLFDLVTHSYGVFKSSKPIPRISLLLVRLGRQIVREDDDGKEEWMRDLVVAVPQMLDGIIDVG